MRASTRPPAKARYTRRTPIHMSFCSESLAGGSSSKGGIRQISRSATTAAAPPPMTDFRVAATAPAPIVIRIASKLPPPRMPKMTFSSVASGNTTDAVRITESMTRIATMALVKMFRPRLLIQGPSTALSLHRSRRKTVALGKRTPASVCTALVRRPRGAPGTSTSPAATTIKPQ